MELTKKEQDIMKLVSKGYTIKYISSKLYMAESTVLTHLQNIYDGYDIPTDKTYNRRLRAVYLFNKNEQKKYPLKVLKCFKIAEKHIQDYKDWLQQESEG